MSTKKDLDNLLQRFVDEGLSGCGLMVTQHGETLYENYAGLADREKNTPVTKDSVFRLASMSKIPMYTALLLLYERGVYNLTDPISDWLPEWKESKKYVRTPNGHLSVVPTERPINVSDVLSMKCGLPYCNSKAPSDDPTLTSMQQCMQPLWEKGHYTLRENVEVMSKAVLAFDPGTHWIYGFSSELAAALIEVMSGMDVNEFMRVNLFDPLEMNSTRAHFFGDIQERMVTMYAVKPDGTSVPGPSMFDLKHLPGEEHQAGWARLFSTVEDYSHLMSMLACGGVYKGQRIMGRKTIDMMRSNGLDAVMQKDFDCMYNAGYGYGYGVRTLIDKAAGNHNGSLGAFGWTGGFGTWAEADPEDGVGIVYMHNQSPNGEEYYHHLVRTVAYGLID